MSFMETTHQISVDDGGATLRVLIEPARGVAATWRVVWMSLVTALSLAVTLAVLGGGVLVALLFAVGDGQWGPLGRAGSCLLFAAIYLSLLFAFSTFSVAYAKFWLHLLWGREEIVMDNDHLVVTRFPPQHRRIYQLEGLSSVQYIERPFSTRYGVETLLREFKGRIIFNYYGKRGAMGYGLNRDEAVQVIAAVRERLGPGER